MVSIDASRNWVQSADGQSFSGPSYQVSNFLISLETPIFQMPEFRVRIGFGYQFYDVPLSVAHQVELSRAETWLSIGC